MTIMDEVKMLNAIEERLSWERFGCSFADLEEDDREFVVFDARDEFEALN